MSTSIHGCGCSRLVVSLHPSREYRCVGERSCEGEGAGGRPPQPAVDVQRACPPTHTELLGKLMLQRNTVLLKCSIQAPKMVYPQEQNAERAQGGTGITGLLWLQATPALLPVPRAAQHGIHPGHRYCTRLPGRHPEPAAAAAHRSRWPPPGGHRPRRLHRLHGHRWFDPPQVIP